MNNIKKSIIIFSFLLGITSVYSQKVDNENLINNIKKDVTSFFITKDVLKKDVVKDELGYVIITEIKDEKVIGYNYIGIYTIGVYQSHSNRHILIKEYSQYKIYDLNDIGHVINEVIAYSYRNHLDANTMLFYIKNIIQKYDDNYNYEYTSIEKKQ